jgi:hypothetical protein
MDIAHDVCAIEVNCLSTRGPQGRVECRALFCCIHLGTGKKCGTMRIEIAFCGKAHQKVEYFTGDALLGVIKCDAGPFGEIGAPTRGVLREYIAKSEVAEADCRPQ